MAYNKPIPDYGDLMTVEEFVKCVESGGFIDYDGWGNPAQDPKLLPWLVESDIKMDDSINIIPSKMNIPRDATHIVWYNR